MVKSLLAIVRSLRRAWLLETVGAGLIVAGGTVAWGPPAGFIGAGACLVLKAFELDGDA